MIADPKSIIDPGRGTGLMSTVPPKVAAPVGFVEKAHRSIVYSPAAKVRPLEKSATLPALLNASLTPGR